MMQNSTHSLLYLKQMNFVLILPTFVFATQSSSPTTLFNVKTTYSRTASHGRRSKTHILNNPKLTRIGSGLKSDSETGQLIKLVIQAANGHNKPLNPVKMLVTPRCSQESESHPSIYDVSPSSGSTLSNIAKIWMSSRKSKRKAQPKLGSYASYQIPSPTSSIEYTKYGQDDPNLRPDQDKIGTDQEVLSDVSTLHKSLPSRALGFDGDSDHGTPFYDAPSSAEGTGRLLQSRQASVESLDSLSPRLKNLTEPGRFDFGFVKGKWSPPQPSEPQEWPVPTENNRSRLQSPWSPAWDGRSVSPVSTVSAQSANIGIAVPMPAPSTETSRISMPSFGTPDREGSMTPVSDLGSEDQLSPCDSTFPGWTASIGTPPRIGTPPFVTEFLKSRSAPTVAPPPDSGPAVSHRITDVPNDIYPLPAQVSPWGSSVEARSCSRSPSFISSERSAREADQYRTLRNDFDPRPSRAKSVGQTAASQVQSLVQTSLDRLRVIGGFAFRSMNANASKTIKDEDQPVPRRFLSTGMSKLTGGLKSITSFCTSGFGRRTHQASSYIGTMRDRFTDWWGRKTVKDDPPSEVSGWKVKENGDPDFDLPSIDGNYEKWGTEAASELSRVFTDLQSKYKYESPED